MALAAPLALGNRRQSSSDISFDLGLELISAEAFAAAKHKEDFIRRPYLQLGTSSSVIVRWRSKSSYTGEAYIGESANSLKLINTENNATAEHSIKVSGLKANTKYYYNIGKKGEKLVDTKTHFFYTAPKIGTDQSSRFWVLGDSGTANQNAKNVYNAYRKFNAEKRTDLVLMLGDNAYNNGTDKQFTKSVFDIYPEIIAQTPLWSCIGNHEVNYPGGSDSPSQTGPYYEAFDFPTKAESGGLASGTEAYYSFDYGQIHFLSLDSADSDLSKTAAMYKWAEQDLANTQQKWLVVFFHHPPYTKGSHNSDKDSDSGGRLLKMRKNFLPLLEQYGVDLCLSGHSHSYERSFLIDGHYDYSNTFSKKHQIDAGDGRTDGDGAYEKKSSKLAAHEGAVYITAGSSGKISGGKLDHPAMFLSLRELGSVIVDVDGGKMDVIFLNDKAEIKDSFQIKKPE